METCSILLCNTLIQNLLSGGSIPVVPLEGLSHDQYNELSCANANNNDPGPSSSNADHLCTYDSRGTIPISVLKLF
jgi:hypothetical protein